MPKSFIIAIAAFVIMLAGWHASLLLDHRLHVTVFDIGQGDSILIRRGDHELLIDGGPNSVVLARIGAAMPYWDRTIEDVVLTHPHADHYAGLVDVFRRYDVKRVTVSGATNPDEKYARFEEAMRRETANIVTARTGDEFVFDEHVRLRVLWPGDKPLDDDPNDSSVVLMLEANGKKILLMGDATAKVEEVLLAAHADVDADVLKVGHHGSKYSSSKKFLQAVTPELAAISVGKNNYGHPSKATLKRLRDAGAKIWRIDKNGSADIIIDSGGYRVCKPASWCAVFGARNH